MKIFPHAMIRVAGETYDLFYETLNNLTFVKLIDAAQQIINKKAFINESLSALLLEFMTTLDDRKTQNIIQNFRRDMFNGRPIPPAKYNLTLSIVNEKLRSKICDSHRLKSELDEDFRLVSSQFDEYLMIARKNLYNLPIKNTLHSGLLLSSRSFLNELYSYEKRDFEEHEKGLLKLENTLLKYLTRIFTKTSPLSTFTNVGICSITNHVNEALFKAEKKQIKSFVKLNNQLFTGLMQNLTKSPFVYRNLNIRLNPSIISENNKFVYVTFRSNTDVFKEITTSKILEWIYEQVNSSAVLTFEQLNDLMSTKVNADYPSIEKYILNLISEGFLEFHWNISIHDEDAHQKFINKFSSLASLGDPTCKLISDYLTSLQKILSDYSNATFAKRQDLLDSAFSEYKSLIQLQLELLNNQQGQMEQYRIENIMLASEKFLYEDTFIELEASLDENVIKKTCEAIDNLLAHTSLMRFDINSRQLAKFVFDKFYKKDEEVYFLKFAKTFYEFHASEKENGVHNIFETFKISSIEDLNTEKKLWLENILNASEVDYTNAEIKISPATFVVARTPRSYRTNRDSSLGALVQFYKNDEGDFISVLNSAIPGYGKYLGRFLYMMPDRIISDLKKWNIEETERTIFVENKDASFFNANSRPQLFSHKLLVANSNESIEGSKYISLKDIIVRFDAEANEMILVHRQENKRLIFLDLDLQAAIQRSKIFQLLLDFSPVSNSPSLKPFIHAINGMFQKRNSTKSEEVICLPRIVYDKKIVLQRKTWIIPKEALPSKVPEESNLAYAVRINAWRNSMSIPVEIYVYIETHNKKLVAEPSKDKAIEHNDDYKPQYINLSNPLLLGLLNKLMRKVKSSMRIEEALPSGAQMLNISGKNYPCEFLIQWGN